MRLVGLGASVVALALGACTELRAQTPQVQVQTVGAVHMAALRAREGVVRVYVSSDVSAGDTVAGLMVAEPTGATPQARDANLGRLNGYVVEWQDRRAAVAERRYEWLIPRALRTGTGAVVLRDGQGQIVSRALLPVDPVPFPPPPESSAAQRLELPVEGQSGMTAVIRGAFDGRLTGRTVTLGTAQVQLLAASPRQLVFLVPTTLSGPFQIRLTGEGQASAGPAPFRIVSVQAEVPSLGQGQQGTLRVTVSGLAGISGPVQLTLRNRSPAVVRVDDIERPILIQPGQVTRQGTFVVNRQLTGLRLGAGNLFATVASRPLAQFDLTRSMTRTLTAWQARTGVAISTDADAGIRRGVVATQTMLDGFLGSQQANQGDVQSVLAALVGDYCFDLRDARIGRLGPTVGALPGPPVVFAAFGQGQPGATEITSVEVGRLSFADFFSRLINLTKEQQSVGYLFVSSTPTRAPIAVDGMQSGQLTNRRFVTIAGNHDVAIGAAKPCRQSVTVTAYQTKVVDCGS